MQVSGSTTFNAPRQQVWELFNDPDALGRATPGCERLEPVGEDVYEAELMIGIAAVKGRYKGKIEMRDRKPPEQYELAIEGTGSAGFVNAVGGLSFVEQGDATEVNYDWDIKAGGAIAGVGQRVLGGVARWLIGEFFKNMQRELGGWSE